jgi:hypothetical protein
MNMKFKNRSKTYLCLFHYMVIKLLPLPVFKMLVPLEWQVWFIFGTRQLNFLDFVKDSNKKLFKK